MSQNPKFLTHCKPAASLAVASLYTDTAHPFFPSIYWTHNQEQPSMSLRSIGHYRENTHETHKYISTEAEAKSMNSHINMLLSYCGHLLMFPQIKTIAIVYLRQNTYFVYCRPSYKCRPVQACTHTGCYKIV